MAKPKPRASAPAAPLGAPPAKFYDGPTVSSTASDKARRKSSPRSLSAQQEAYKPVPVVPKVTPSPSEVQVVKVRQPRRKRSGWTLWSMITLLPLLLFASLFSTVLCPPDLEKPSSFSQMALSSLGLKTESTGTSLHRTLCYPANVYHREVLAPYVYPALEDYKVKVTESPIFKNAVEPTYQAAKDHTLKVWNGPLKPVVTRTGRGAQIFHRTYVAPHVPYVRAKFTEATAPLRMRIYALYQTYLAPHVQVAQKHACTAYKHSKATFHHVAGHPVTAQAGKHAQNAFSFSRQQGARAYDYSRPHAIWAYNQGKHHTHHTVLPRVIYGLEVAGNQIQSTWTLVKAHAAKFYADNLAEHLDPYVGKVNTALQPVYANYDKLVYVPLIKPVIHSIFPPQEKPKSFWSYFTDSAPTAGSNVGQKVFEAPKKAAENIKENVKQAAADASKKATEVKEAAEAKTEAVKKAAEERAAAAKKAADEKAAEAKKATDKAAEKAAEAKDAAAKKAEDVKAAADEKLKQPTDEEIEAEIAANARAAFKRAEASRAAAEKSKGGMTQTAGTSITATASSSAACDSTTGAAADASKDHLADARAQTAQLKKKIDFQGKALYAKVQTETVKQGEHFLELLPEMKKIGDENLEREINRMVGGLDRLYSNSRTLTPHQVDESQRMSDAKVVKVLDQVTNGVKTKKNQIYEKVQPAVTNAQAEMDRVLGDEYAALGKRLSIIEGVSSKDWDAYKALKKDVEAWKTKLHDAPEKSPSKQLKDVIHKVQVGAAETITDFADMYEGWKTRQGILRKQAMDRIQAREAVASESQRARQATIPVPKKDEEDGRVSILPITETEPAQATVPNPTQTQDGKVSILPIKDKEPLLGKVKEGQADSVPLLGKVKEQVEDALSAADAAAKSSKDEL